MIDRLCRIRELISIPRYNIYIYIKKEGKKERVKKEKRTTTEREKKSLVS